MLDKTVADQVSSWKNSRGLTDEAVKGHSCSGNTCSYTQIGDAYICEKTGRVHGNTYFLSISVYPARFRLSICWCVIRSCLKMFLFLFISVCDDACREFVLDQSSGLLLCTISGHCFERWLCPDDEWDTDDTVSPLQSSLLSFFHWCACTRFQVVSAREKSSIACTMHNIIMSLVY